MNIPLYKKYENTKPVGIYCLSNFGGIEILDIEHGFDDFAVSCFNFGTGRQKIRKRKICYSRSGKPYIWMNRSRYYLDDFYRC